MTKAQIAAHLGYSVRWVSSRVAEGIPPSKIAARARIRAAIDGHETGELAALRKRRVG